MWKQVVAHKMILNIVVLKKEDNF